MYIKLDNTKRFKKSINEKKLGQQIPVTFCRSRILCVWNLYLYRTTEQRGCLHIENTKCTTPTTAPLALVCGECSHCKLCGRLMCSSIAFYSNAGCCSQHSFKCGQMRHFRIMVVLVIGNSN